MRFTPGVVPIMRQPQPSHRPMGHAHFWERALSRRQIIKTAAGGTAVALGSGLWMPGLAEAAGRVPADPKPIPEVFIPGTPFHVLSPASEEPSTIYDFNGLVGATEIQGTGTDGLLFDVDMRFMQGVYVGVDGRVHQDTFGFVWLDVYKGQFDFINFSTQIHDFDPGIHPYPDGLFWTVRIPDESVEVDLGAGRASVSVTDLRLRDFFSIPNALNNGASADATVSYTIHWQGVHQRRQVRNETLHVAGLFLDTDATIQWTGSNALGFTFTSDPAEQTVVSAQLGHERNGVFF